MATGSGKTVVWRCSQKEYIRYQELMELILAQQDEDSEEHWTFVDDIRRLPGWPTNYDWETDEVLIDVQESIFSYNPDSTKNLVTLN